MSQEFGESTAHVDIPKARGGRRPGAGRPRSDVRWYTARGIHPLTAAQVLAEIGDERKLWRRLLSSKDDRVVMQAVVYLTSMRDGKPAQQINVTSTTITLKPEDIERARMIAREIRGEIGDADAIAPRNLALPASPLQVDAHGPALDSAEHSARRGEGTANIMLGDGGGGKLDGDGVAEEVE